MFRHRIGLCSSLAMSLALTSACTKIDNEAGSKYTGTNNPLLTTAGVRAIQRNQIKDINAVTGKITPVNVGCAEPPPDIAIALGAGQGAGAALSGLPALAANPPAAAAAGAAGASPGSIDVSLAAASSHSEAVAQLGERLATIQLLRDGLYRACEAYANGAITPTMYAVIVSRLDKLLVTLIATEIAGGAFGRQFSAASTDASGNSSASQIKSSAAAVAKALDEQKKATETESAEQVKLADLRGQRTAKQQELAGATPERTTALNQEIAALDTQITAQEKVAADASAARIAADKALQEAARDQALTQAVSAQTTATGTATGGGGIAATRTIDTTASLAGEIGKIQSNYINEVNVDALVVSCITELNQTPAFNSKDPKTDYNGKSPSQLAVACDKYYYLFPSFIHDALRLKAMDAASHIAGEACAAQKTPAEKMECVKSVVTAATQIIPQETYPKNIQP